MFHSLVLGFLFLTITKNPGCSAGVEITEVRLQPVGSTSGKRNNGKSQKGEIGQRQSS
jgi:hypothetical protein